MRKKSRETKMKLPPELEMDILSRLPVKSLLRFRCVSKEWLQLLTTNTHFINNMHLPRSLKANSTNPNPSLISLSEYEVSGTHNWYLEDYRVADESKEGVVKPIYVDLPVSVNENTSFHYNYRCGGICNGLVCLALYRFTITYSDLVPLRLFVWNPLTTHHITLSSLPLPSLYDRPYAFTVFGFGFHPPTEEYKVVRILTNLNRPSPISVHTIGTKTWRNIGVVSYDFGFWNFPTTINGAPHWAVFRIRSQNQLIVTFDLKDEVLQEILLPFPTDNHSLRITEFGGLLCVIVHSTLQKDIEMWVMKEHGVASSWTMLFKIGEFEIPMESWDSSLWDWTPTGISSNGEITLRSNSEPEDMKLLIYNPKTNSFKGPIKLGLPWKYVFIFGGSLISPKAINGGAQEVTLTEEI